MPTQLPAAPIVVAPRETGIIVDTVAQLLTNALTDAGIVGIDESIEQPILNRAMTQAGSMDAQAIHGVSHSRLFVRDDGSDGLHGRAGWRH